ncbi:MAG: 50S ribosomal protein L30 [Fimbriimonadaceae bacterium]
MLRIKLVRSPIGNTKRNRAVVQALGLRKLHQVVEKEDTPGVRGMIQKVRHMVEVEEVQDAAPKASPRKTKKAEEESNESA